MVELAFKQRADLSKSFALNSLEISRYEAIDAIHPEAEFSTLVCDELQLEKKQQLLAMHVTTYHSLFKHRFSAFFRKGNSFVSSVFIFDFLETHSLHIWECMQKLKNKRYYMSRPK